MYRLNVYKFLQQYVRINSNPDLTHENKKTLQSLTCGIVAHRLIIEKETTKKVNSLRVLVGGLSRLTRGSSGSEVNREIFPRTTNRAQPDTDFYYSHRTFSCSRRGKCVPTRVTGNARKKREIDGEAKNNQNTK